MILIPEQVKALRDKIYILEEQKRSYDEYNKTDERNLIAPRFEDYIDNTFETRDNSEIEKNLKKYKDVLKEGEFLTKVNEDEINYGTMFDIKFDDDDEIERWILSQNSIGLKSTNFEQINKYISAEGKLGQAIKGKKEGETFSYTITTKEGTLALTGTIIKIVNKTKKDINFIISRPMSERHAKKKLVIDCVEPKKDEITINQYRLLEEEKKHLENALRKFEVYENRIIAGSLVTLEVLKGKTRTFEITEREDMNPREGIIASSPVMKKIFSKKVGDRIEEVYYYKENGKRKGTRYYGTIIDIDNSKVEREESIYKNIYQVKSRLRKVNRLLETAKVITSIEDDKVGIGSKLTLITFENNDTKMLRVEVINEAVSSEDNYSYIEATSSLGASIIGLSNNERFEYLDDNNEIKEGMVCDINNNVLEKVAPNPLVYQNKRRG